MRVVFIFTHNSQQDNKYIYFSKVLNYFGPCLSSFEFVARIRKGLHTVLKAPNTFICVTFSVLYSGIVKSYSGIVKSPPQSRTSWTKWLVQFHDGLTLNHADHNQMNEGCFYVWWKISVIMKLSKAISKVCNFFCLILVFIFFECVHPFTLISKNDWHIQSNIWRHFISCLSSPQSDKTESK